MLFQQCLSPHYFPDEAEESCWSRGWQSKWMINNYFCPFFPPPRAFSFPPSPTSVHCSILPAKFKYVTQHCDIADKLCISPCESHTLASLVSFTLHSRGFQMCVFLHTPAAKLFKAHRFLQDNKIRGKEALFRVLVCFVCCSGFVFLRFYCYWTH